MTPDPESPSPQDEDSLRPHSYDGIQEFDKRLPNWWLLTLYGSILFAVVYWFVHFESRVVASDGERIKREMDRIEAVRLSALVKILNDDNLWKMSQNTELVAAGAATFKSTCVQCHGDDLKGKIGPNLIDTDWIHGGRPTEVFNTVKNGVPAKGMVSWGPLLGDKRIAEVVAFVMSHHKPGEPVRIVPSPTAGGTAAPAN
jgi:cytochrome c oxidase cbb3-type subunit 3